MMRIRPVRADDLDALHALALRSGIGMTTLPKNRDSLREKIQLSEDSFARSVEAPGHEYYLFVLEDTVDGGLYGTSALAAAVGLDQPFYTYTVGRVVHASPQLKVHTSTETLYLGHDFTGCTEICTLFLDPQKRGGANGRLLSRARFLFLAEFAERFSPRIIAEMRGVSDAEGHSPFWEALGRKFFAMEFAEADALCAFGNQFIAELMPKYPIYISLLPEAAQKVIGRVHPDTQPAYDLLLAEGFRYTGHVDIFDAGPTLAADVRDIRTARNSQRVFVNIVDSLAGAEPQKWLISNTHCAEFRALLADAAPHEDGSLLITAETANALDLAQGASVRASKLV